MSREQGSVSSTLGFAENELLELERIEGLLDVRMKEARKRHAHSLGVARTADKLARCYGVNRFEAVAAGLLHDWDKGYDDEGIRQRARDLGK